MKKIESFSQLYVRCQHIQILSRAFTPLLGKSFMRRHDLLNEDPLKLRDAITERLKEVMEEGEYDQECTDMLFKVVLETRTRLLGVDDDE